MARVVNTGVNDQGGSWQRAAPNPKVLRTSLHEDRSVIDAEIVVGKLHDKGVQVAIDADRQRGRLDNEARHSGGRPATGLRQRGGGRGWPTRQPLTWRAMGAGWQHLHMGKRAFGLMTCLIVKRRQTEQ